MIYSFEVTLLTVIIMLTIGIYCLVMSIEDIQVRKR